MKEKNKPAIAGLRSIKLETEPGRYYWCSCGLSTNQPFCNGAHAGTGFEPLPVVITEKQLVKWCSCKYTRTPPFCDNTHRELPGYEKDVNK